jgi:hypothetical protein
VAVTENRFFDTLKVRCVIPETISVMASTKEKAENRSKQPSDLNPSRPRSGHSQKPDKKTKSTAFGLPAWWSFACVALVIGFFGFIRIHLADFPLERDEGEYAYAGQLIMHGIDPYAYCYSMKLPGTASAYALFMAVFGQTAVGVHLGLLLVNAASILLLYLLASRLYGKLAGVVASATFALLSLEPAVLGFAGHATQFVVMPAIGGILLLVMAIEAEKKWLFFCSGVCLGLSFLMKQPGVFFVVFGTLYLGYSEWARGSRYVASGVRLALLLVGSALPFAVVCLLYWWSGNFHRFWFWIYYYANQYGAIVPLSRGWQNFKGTGFDIVSSAAMLWLLAMLGIVAAFWWPRVRAHSVLVIGLLIFSFAAVCPGLYFRAHYFVLILPAVSILCGLAIERATELLRATSVGFLRAAPVLIFSVALIVPIVKHDDFFFAKDRNSLCHRVYGANPFPEAPRIADFIRSRANTTDEIAVIGSEPQIYFYSGLRSATGFVYMYPLMEHVSFAKVMQQEMEREVESAKPRFVVFAAIPESWLRHADSEGEIFDWSRKYLADHYQLVGLVDLMGDDTEFHFDDDARNYKYRSSSRVLIYQRT